MTISATTQGLRPGACTSTNRPAVPYDGMVVYETDTDRIVVYDGSSWVYKTQASTVGSVLQVVSTTKLNQFTTTSTTMTDVTGLSVSIAPRSTSNNVLVVVSIVTGNNNASCFNAFNLVRNSTNIGIATGGTSVNYTSHVYPNNASGGWSHYISFLDSPSTISSTTYKLQMAVPNGGTGVIGRYAANDAAGAISSITVMEVAG